MRWATIALLSLTCAVGLIAQVQQAALEGRVVDSSGSPIPGATVQLRDPATNQYRLTTTDIDGKFRLTNVPPSVYELRVELSGFNAYTEKDLQLVVGRTRRVDIALPSMSETVEVTAGRPALDASQTVTATVIDTERIEELPVRSRNYLEFVLLAPSVVSTQTAARSPVPDSGFSFAGMRPRSNTLTIDGLDNNDEYSGSNRTELSLESIKEFEVISGGSGGEINVVTKSGTNVVHGDVFLFGQAGRLSRYRSGGAVGGPIVRDRTFYYAAAEQEHARGKDSARIDPRTLAAIPALTAGLFATGRNETELSAKITHQIAPSHSLMVRLAVTNNTERGDAFNTGGLTDYSSRGTNATRDAGAVGWWTAILGQRMTNELRGQLATRRVDLRTTDETGPSILIPGVVDFGRPYSGNSRHHQTYAQAGDTVVLVSGRHVLRGGFDITRIHVSGTTGDGFGGVYLFPSLDAFLARQPDSFRQVFGDGSVQLRATRSSAFVQDQWTHASVTVDFGARLDGERLLASLGVSSRQFTPRLGVAWTPHAGWVIRGSVGTFAERLPLVAFERALVVNGTKAFEQVIDAAGVAAPSIHTVRRGRWAPSSQQISVGAEHLFTPEMTASTNILFTRGRHLLRTVNIGLPRSDVFEVQPTASSTYRGFTMAVNRRFTDEVEWSAAYTWSKTMDDASDFDEQPQNPHALQNERAPSRYDQRHRFVASARFEVGYDIEVAPILTIESGRPVNPTTGTDDLRTHAFPPTARPPGYGRNSLRLPASATLNVRVLKYFPVKPHGRLDLLIEAFNLLNRRNVTELNSVWASPDFGRPIQTSSRRQMQFAVDFEF